MWRHYCKPTRGWLSNLIGEPCNWCDCTDDDAGADQ